MVKTRGGSTAPPDPKEHILPGIPCPEATGYPGRDAPGIPLQGKRSGVPVLLPCRGEHSPRGSLCHPRAAASAAAQLKDNR